MNAIATSSKIWANDIWNLSQLRVQDVAWL